MNSQLELLGISKGAYYYKPKGESAESLEMMREIDREHTEHPTKGVEGMVDHLLLLGFIVGPKRVRRLMRKCALPRYTRGKACPDLVSRSTGCPICSVAST